MEFYNTIAGHRFYEHQLPELVRVLEKIAAELKRANDLKEQEIAAADLHQLTVDKVI